MPPYPAPVAKLLHALAESRPTPEQYAAERTRILKEALHGTSDRQPARPR